MSKLATTNPSICGDKLQKSCPKMSRSQRQISAKSVVKKHYSERKSYWCTPRKVKSIDSTEKVDNSLVNIVKPKKGKSKKRRKAARKCRRIDILAQPKYVKSQRNPPSFGVTASARKPKIGEIISRREKKIICPRRALKTSKKGRVKNSANNFTARSKLRDSSAIAIPKKLGLRLFSLVTKRIKELTQSKAT